jgi:hypothetical protein
MEPKPARMAEEIRFVFFAGQRHGVIGLSGSGHARETSGNRSVL